MGRARPAGDFMAPLKAIAAAVLALTLTGCVGALAGGTFSFDSPTYWGAVDVLVTSAAGAPNDGVALHGDFGSVVMATTNATGHARLEVTWKADKHSAHDATSDYLCVTVSIAGKPESITEVLVRPGRITPLTLTFSKGQDK